MGKGSKTPATPDPYETAAAESQFNRLDTYSPSGSGTRYGYTDANGNFVQGVAPKGQQSAVSTIESPWEKSIRESLQPASVDLVNRVIADDVTNIPSAATPKDMSALTQQIYDAGYARMKPQFEQENNRTLTNLQSRGIPIGSEAFGETMAQQQQGVNDALQQLSLGAAEQASTEQSRQFALDSAARQNAVSELVAAMGGNYNPPSATPSGNASKIDYSGMVRDQYNAQVSAANAKSQSNAATAGTLGTLGAAMIMKSDRRLKRDIVLIGRRGPFRIYHFRYIWDRPGTVRRGYMAQEVLRMLPGAVLRMGGWLALDYSKLPEV